MKITNLVLSLLERERYGNRKGEKKFSEVLEYKTASLSTIHINYDLHEAARSTFVIAFSPDQTKIATSHGNHTVKISDCYTFKNLLTLTGHPRTPWCVTFHPKINSLLASGCLGGQVRVWDLNKIGKENVVFQSQAVISSLSFHPVDDILAISTHNKIVFYDWNAQQILKTIQNKHHSETVRLVRFLPDGSKLITGITNASSQYCRPERLNVSTRGDPHGHSVVQSVSCMRMQRVSQNERASERTVSSSSEQTENKKSIGKKCEKSCRSNEADHLSIPVSDKLQQSNDQKGNRLKRKIDDQHTDSSFSDSKSSVSEPINSGGKSAEKDNGSSINSDSSSNVHNYCTCKKKVNNNNNTTTTTTTTITNNNNNNDNNNNNEHCKSKKSRLSSLSRKSCIFFRQPPSTYTSEEPSRGTEESTSSQVLREGITPTKSNTSGSASNCSSFRVSSSIISSSNNHSTESASSSGAGHNENSPSTERTTNSRASGGNANSTTVESMGGTSSVRIFIEDGNRNTSEVGINTDNTEDVSISRNNNTVTNREQTEHTEANHNRLQRPNISQQQRSEIWNFNLGPSTPSEQSSTSQSLNDLDISVEGAASTIPVHGYITFPFSHVDQSTDVTNLLGVRTAVATATARSSYHVHTAVVIASQENENSETTLQTAVNRAIAGAFAGSGEGAVANNIIDTTHRLQLWDTYNDECPDIENEHKNVIVPLCKIHNDSSFDVSQDSSYMAVFVPSEQGFPNDAEIKVISLKPETFLQCIYSRKYGPNAVSVSLSSLNNYLMVGLASRKLDWQLSSNQLIGQILKLPSSSDHDVNREDKSKPVLNILHTCNQNQRSNVSVNTLRFHPTPGMGLLYGTNRGHVQHCHIAPDHKLTEKRRVKRSNVML